MLMVSIEEMFIKIIHIFIKMNELFGIYIMETDIN